MRNLLLGIVLVIAGGANAQVITLDSVLRTIDRTHPMLKMYDAMAAARETYASGASSWMPPKLSAGLWQTPYSAIGDGMFMIGIEQMIPNPSKTGAKASMMRSEAALDTATRAYERNDLYAMAKRAYYSWSVLKRKAAFLATTDSLLNFIINVATERYPSGKELLENIYKAKATRAELHSMQTMVASEMRMKNIELNTVLNIDKNTSYDIDTTLPIVSTASLPTDAAYLQTHRSDLRQIEASIEMMRTKREYEHSALYPDFGISANHMQALGPMPNQFSVMGMITIPIAPWSRGDADAMTGGIDAEIESLRLKERATLNTAEGDAAMLRTQLANAREQLRITDESTLPAYRKAFDATLTSYQQNTGDLFRVLDAWQMLRMAETNRLDQLQTLINLQVTYEQTMEIR